MVGGGRRGGGCAPGRVVGGANAKGGGGRGADMDKLKKVLSGQDTEDRSGLSEVSAPGKLAFLGTPPCSPPARGVELCGDTATGGSAGSLWKAWLPNPLQHSLRRA